MNEAPKVPKLPFITAYILSFTMAFTVVLKAEHPISTTDALIAAACVLLGSILCCLPFIKDYNAATKMLELNTLGAVADQMRDLKKFAADVSAATDRWALVQETTKGNTDKTVAAAKEIADHMTEEIREFNEFQQKLNDTEKAALRLEVEKLRRTEAEWIQVAARILDHIYTLNTAASRSGNPDLASQIANFQNACRDAARRVGLGMYSAEPEEKFDAQKFRAHGVENPPADAMVAETLAPGITFQGRLLRPALVRLQTAEAPAAEPAAPAETSAGEPAAEPAAVSEPAPEATGDKPASAAGSGSFALEQE